MHPLIGLLILGTAFGAAVLAKRFVPRFAGWNFIALMLLAVVIESFAIALLGAILVR